MKTSATICFSIITGFGFNAVQAEIVEIPPEEMTEAYIKDTTVIVRKKAPVPTNEKRTLIRVSPLEEDFSEGQTLDSEMDSFALIEQQQNLTITDQQANDLNARASYDFVTPNMDPNELAREDNLRAVLGLPEGSPIDYSTLQFPTGTALNPESGIGSNSGSQGFQLQIPNANGIPAQSFTTPNGEFGVNVTPEGITFQMNTPRN
tara:strand:+ start:1326 stop:1940 length:615 start_codon:yes stop_codon:yes gene_type:complete